MHYLEIIDFPDLDMHCKEAMNMLCMNLSCCAEGARSIMLTSRYAAEGKSLMAMNLLRSFAGHQKKVIMLDADLRMSKFKNGDGLRFRGGEGGSLAEYLEGKCSSEDIIYETNIPNAHIIPAGKSEVESLALLDTLRMEKLMESLAGQYDIVLVDTPSAGDYADAMAIARYCDGALIVVSYKRGTSKDIAGVKRMLLRAKCKVLGYVMNNVDFEVYSNRRRFFGVEFGWARNDLHTKMRQRR